MGPSNAFQACIMKPFKALQELPRSPSEPLRSLSQGGGGLQIISGVYPELLGELWSLSGHPAKPLQNISFQELL